VKYAFFSAKTSENLCDVILTVDVYQLSCYYNYCPLFCAIWQILIYILDIMEYIPKSAYLERVDLIALEVQQKIKKKIF